MAAAEFRKLINQNYSTICELLPATPRSLEDQNAVALEYIQQVKECLVDEPEKYAKFSRLLQEAASQRIEMVQGGSGTPGIRLKGVPVDAVESVKASLEGYDELVLGADSFLGCKFEVFDRVISDELPGLVELEEGIDKEFVSNWCSFLAKVGGKLSGSGRCKYELLRQLNNFNLGLINRYELGVVVADMIGEYLDLMEEFGSLLLPLDHEEKDEDEEDGYKSNCFSDLAKDNGRKRKRKQIAKAHKLRPLVACKRRRRSKKQSREITYEEEDDMGYADILEGQLAQAHGYALRSLAGNSGTSEPSIYLSTGKVYFERIVKEMYGDEGPKVLAMVEEDPVNTLPVVISRLQQQEWEHKNRKDDLRSRISTRAYGK